MNNISIEQKERVAILTINRPEKLNALNKETINELHLVLKEMESNPEIKVIIITGSGTKAFVAGADISEFAHFDVKQGEILAREGQNKLFDFVENLKKPVIAAINGFALGGGLELAMACHFRTASTNAKMGLPEVTLGVIPGYGGTQRLTQLVGKGKAMELIMTANMLTADEALKYNLVNHVVSQEELITFTLGLANKIASNSASAISKAIEAINDNFKDGVNGYHTEITNFGYCFGTADFSEGTTAFLEKRKPNF